MTSKFKKYAGKLTVTIGEGKDKEELELDVKLPDIQKIMAHQKGEMTEESIEKISETFMNILKRSYPEEDEKNLQSFLVRKYTDFLVAFSEAMGWASKEEIEERKSELKKKGLPQSL